MKTNQQQVLNPCEQCAKKEQLLQQYASCHSLNNRNNLTCSSNILKQSIDAATTCTTTLGSNQRLSKALLLIKLILLQRSAKKQVFQNMRQLAIQQKCHKGFKIVQTLDRLINRRTQEATRNLWMNKNKQLICIERQEYERSHNSALTEPFKNMTQLLPREHISLNEKTRNMSRKLFAQNHLIQSLKWQKKALFVQIEQNYRRQDIQSKKKKQSLQMLAEQLAEKNELISQLTQTIKFYETKLGKGGNVLQDDNMVMQKQLQALQKANEKINLELDRRTEQVTKLEEQVKMFSQKQGRLQAENTSLKEKNFDMFVQLQSLQKKKKEYYSLSAFLQRKLSNLKKYEKILSNNLKALDQCSLGDKSSFNNSLKRKNSRFDTEEGQNHTQEKQEILPFTPISIFEAQYKIEKVLNYIFNIEIEDLWIKNEEKLFDNEQLQVLNGLKLKFIQLTDQVKAFSKPKKAQKSQIVEVRPNIVRLSQQYGSSEEVWFNRNHISGSIFEILVSQKNTKEKDINKMTTHFEDNGCPRCKNGANEEMTTRKDDQNFTIRLLSLQLQKNKQVEKISQLKNKLMHIRCIVMNFIKCIDLRSVSKEAKDIIEIFCEFFQYSQEEKQTIYQLGRKQKKFLGWF